MFQDKKKSKWELTRVIYFAAQALTAELGGPYIQQLSNTSEVLNCQKQLIFSWTCRLSVDPLSSYDFCNGVCCQNNSLYDYSTSWTSANSASR